MTPVRVFLKFLSLIFILSLLSACSQQIQGRVFLDKNGNNAGDQGELAIPGVPYTVTLDNAYFASGITQPGGKYSVTLDALNSEGKYCVKVDEGALASLKFSIPKKAVTQKTVTAKALSAKSASSETSEENACPVDDQGAPDCNDENCCNETECESASVCQDTTDTETAEEDNTCPTDDSNQPICSDSRCANKTACNTDQATVKPMEACGQLAKTTMVMTLDVPIAMDYSSRLEQSSSPPTVFADLGDEIEIDITYPSSCVFDPYTLPAPFYPVGLKGFYNEYTRLFSLDKAINRNPSRVDQNDTPPLGHDALDTYHLALKVVSSPGQEDTEYAIQPTLLCPDGNRVTAQANSITLAKDAGISVHTGISPHCPAQGESAIITSIISNPSSAPVTNANFKVSIPGGENLLTLTDFPQSCLNKGDGIECEIDHILSGEKKIISLEFKMDDSVPAGTQVQFTPQLTVDDGEYSEAGITCNY